MYNVRVTKNSFIIAVDIKLIIPPKYTGMKYCILLFALVLVAYSCKSNKVAPESNGTPQELTLAKPSKDSLSLLCARTWTHAREQSNDGKALYLDSEKHTFPTSRYRNSFEFNPDGTCRFMFFSPTDRHTMIDGRYTYVNDDLHIMSTDGQSYKSYTVIAIDEEQLLLEAKPIEK